MKHIKEDQVINIKLSHISEIKLINLGIPARPCVPAQENIRRGGEHDHNTNYRMDYHTHGLSLCAAKAYSIAQKNDGTAAPIPT